MTDIGKFLKKPDSLIKKEEGRFERFNLKENPFPSTPFVNKDAEDKRINGNIFEMEIRRKESVELEKNFLRIPQSDPNHLRLGYIQDQSYVGRGNGKSAFLINVQKWINKNFCLDISGDMNKCFAVYLSPEPGGRTKTFDKFLDVLFEAILSMNVIKNCLAVLRLEALIEIKKKIRLERDETGKWQETPPEKGFNPSEYFADENDLVEKLNSSEWFTKNHLKEQEIHLILLKNKYLQSLPEEFPLLDRRTLHYKMIEQQDFQNFYLSLKKPMEKRDFIFSHLIDFFRAAGFNGAYLFVDDFERIPEFQSARQKKDFAFELRSCLFDGLSTNAKIGFYNVMLVLHAGVPRLIEEAWSNSGMEQRAPISSPTTSRHIIPFEKLEKKHVKLLLKRYLSEFRINPTLSDDLTPFTDEAIFKIAELSELNAAKILKMAYELLDKAAFIPEQHVINEHFVASFLQEQNFNDEDKPSRDISSVKTVDLVAKAKGKEQ